MEQDTVTRHDTSPGTITDESSTQSAAPEAGELVVEELVVEELLIEEISIDGMCGVY